MKFLRELEDRDFANLADHACNTPGQDHPSHIVASKEAVQIGLFEYRILEHMDRSNTSRHRATISGVRMAASVIAHHRAGLCR